MVDDHHNEGQDSLLECLIFLARYHDRNLSRDAAISGLPLPNGTLTPALFERAAQRAGLSCRHADTELDSINQALLPAVLLTQDENALILLGYDDNGHPRIIEPHFPETATVLNKEELEARVTRKVIYCRPQFQFDPHASTVQKSTRAHWFWSVIRENRKLYRDVLIAAVLINLFAVAMPLFVMNVYDRVVPNHATHTLWVLSAGLAIVLALDLALRLTRARFVDLAATRADVKISASIMERILGLNLSHRPGSSGAFASNVQSFESVRAFIGSMTVVSLVDLPFVLLFVLIIGIIAWPLVIPIIVGGLLILLYAVSAQRKLHELSEESMQASAMRNATLVESVSHLETIKSFGAEQRLQQRHEEATLFVAHTSAQMRLVSASVTSGAQWTQQMVALSIIIVGVYFLVDGQLSQGGLIAAYLLSSRAMAPISQAAGLLAQYHQAATAMESLDEVMAWPQERSKGRHYVSRPELEGAIEFRNVTFNYPNDDRNSLSEISLRIEPGEHVAVLGKNGSGKSTLEKLILRLYEPSSGSVRVDGIDLQQLDPAELRRNIGYVPQTIELLSGTLRDNILLANPQASDEALVHAAHLSGLTAMANAHSAGFDMPVGENGQMLSGGQKQAVAIARALINNPSMLIMDEPTGALDHSAEETFKKNLNDYAQNKTLLMITHRTALLELASRIIVVDQGQIVADGPKNEVVEALKQGRITGARV